MMKLTQEQLEILREHNRMNEMHGCGSSFMYVLLLALLLMLSGCKTKEVVTTDHKTVHDTTYVVKLSHDSVWIETLKHDSVIIREKGDTVYIERWRTQYRDRWHETITVDTLHDAYVERDTVVVTRTIKPSAWTKAKEQAKGAALGIIAAAIAAFLVWRKLR